ncbi:MAG: hypothetical protein PHF97_06560 [Bacteroidales bacterium]|nr:hypothetical protein [Bacteroidales bacterium]
MKKCLLSMLVLCFSLSVIQAQDLTSKKGIPILPEAGEYGLSIDAVPFFEYAGNLFNGNSFNNAPTWDFPGLGQHGNPMITISGKYFKTANTAYRGRVRIGYDNKTIKNTLWDQTDTNMVDLKTVEDKWTYSSLDISIGLGIEKRRGKGRVQGIYGAMVNLSVSTAGNKIKYGNEMSAKYPTPLSTDYPWVEEENGYATSPASYRVTKDNDGLTFGIGVNAFVGVEYFFAPKMSIGGEFDFGIMFASTGKSKYTVESFDGTSVKTAETKTGGATHFCIDNSNTGGAINLTFYF